MFSTSRFLILILIVSFAVCDLLAEIRPARSSGNTPVVRVMTRNLYMGADYNVIIGAQSPEDVPSLVSEFFANVQATKYPERVKALADEIAATPAHLIGLQEVALYRMQARSDYVTGVTEPNATDVVLDFLALLQSELAARELPYRVVNESVNVDAELPGALSATEFYDLRLTLRNVILARPNVRTTASETGTYEAELTVPIGGASASFTRSYGWVAAVVGGVPFRFVNTHLETNAAPPIQEAQASELLRLLDEAEEPVILVGDFNSAADGSTTGSYAALMSRFTDAYSWAHPDDAGHTCCQSAGLMNAESAHDRRIDLILYRGDVDVTWAKRVGEAPEDRTLSGLWPSDHAGVIAELNVGRSTHREPRSSSIEERTR